MTGSGTKRQGLAGKLLLSSGLVAASLAYGWWQYAARPPEAAPKPHAPDKPAPDRSAMAAPEAAPAAENESAAPRKPHASSRAPKSASAAARQRDTKEADTKETEEANAQAVNAPAAESASAPLSALAELPMYQPPPLQTPLPLVTGTPAPGAAAPIPAGTHLQDGDYLSDRQQYEWGDLTVKISVHGGQITGVQVVQYPDHRPESLQLSQMASPILDSEVIKTQQSEVDVISSATDTSFAFRYAIASAIIKATR